MIHPAIQEYAAAYAVAWALDGEGVALPEKVQERLIKATDAVLKLQDKLEEKE